MLTIIAGTIASIGSILALKQARNLKKGEGHTGIALQTFWLSVSAYMILFTLLRVWHALGWGGEIPWFYAQTIAGASTLISLLYLFFGVLLGPNAARWAAELGVQLAFVTVFLIFFFGVTPPKSDAWGVELLPQSTFARHMVGFLYVAAPAAMSGLILYAARKMEGPSGRRLTLFALSVPLMYAPNAGRYVWITGGPLGALLAWTMALGVLLALYSYYPAPETKTNSLAMPK